MKHRLSLVCSILLAAIVVAPACLGSELRLRRVPAVRVLWVSDTALVRHSQRLAEPWGGQVSVADRHCAELRSASATRPAAVLLDFGRELHGCLELAAAIRPSKRPAVVRVRLGESVSEAMSDVAAPGATATNDHAMRDLTLQVPWLGSVRTGNSGFRFARIDLLDTAMVLNLRSVQAIALERDVPWLGSLHTGNARLDSIWATGARTVQLCMQHMVWDGIKRDRLVWIGDINPEVMTIGAAFGTDDCVGRSLDFARDDTPLPGWMNGMCSYSLWWIITQRDLYLQSGDLDYLLSQRDYLAALLRQIDAQVDRQGVEHLDGTRFIDWPTSERPDVIHCGLQALCVMACEAAGSLASALGDAEIQRLSDALLSRLRRARADHCGSLQAAALNVLAGMGSEADRQLLAGATPSQMTTFYGYYILEALARLGMHDKALALIDSYWGRMLDLGATTFWEELEYDRSLRCGRIDELPAAGLGDLHGEGGDYCYVGHRLSMCHGWASGPTAWLTRHVLGVRPAEPGCRRLAVEPHLPAGCDSVSGSYPTPLGVVTIGHYRHADGSVGTHIDAPQGILVDIKRAKN